MVQGRKASVESGEKQECNNDYWITLGMPGLEQLASAFSWPLPATQRGIHLFNPSVNSRGKALHPCNEKSNNDKKNPFDCSKGMCQVEALLGHIFSTPLSLSSDPDRLLPACSQLPCLQRACPQPATRPFSEAWPLPCALFALEGFQCFAAEASHQRVWKMARESMENGTQQS